MSKLVVGVLVAVVVAVGAGVIIHNNNLNNSTRTDNNNTISQSGNPATGSYTRDQLKEIDDKSCDLLTYDMVMEYAGDSVAESDIDQATYWGCIYEWDKSNLEEIQEFNNQLVTEALSNGVDILSLTGQFKTDKNKVAFSVDTLSPVSTPEALDRSYRTSISRLNEEEKQQNDEIINQVLDNTQEEMNLSEEESQVGDLITDIIVNEQEKAVFTDVNGVGSRAAWSDYARKLVVVHNNMIFTVEVDVEEGNNQDVAKEIANKLIAKM